jgi:hypothetical protein
MRYDVEMNSGGTIYIPSFIIIGSGVQKLLGEGDTQTNKQKYYLISLVLFFSK